MRTGVKIEGKQYFYDLYRVRYLSDLLEGDELLCKSPISEELCRVRVEGFTGTAVKVQELRDGPAAIFWKISLRGINPGVYKINK